MAINIARCFSYVRLLEETLHMEREARKAAEKALADERASHNFHIRSLRERMLHMAGFPASLNEQHNDSEERPGPEQSRSIEARIIEEERRREAKYWEAEYERMAEAAQATKSRLNGGDEGQPRPSE